MSQSTDLVSYPIALSFYPHLLLYSTIPTDCPFCLPFSEPSISGCSQGFFWEHNVHCFIVFVIKDISSENALIGNLMNGSEHQGFMRHLLYFDFF